jgi:hypothetical protein
LDREAYVLAQACARRSAERQLNGAHPRSQSRCPPSPGRHHSREPCREDTAGALEMTAEKLADAELPADACRTPGEISQHALVEWL